MLTSWPLSNLPGEARHEVLRSVGVQRGRTRPGEITWHSHGSHSTRYWQVMRIERKTKNLKTGHGCGVSGTPLRYMVKCWVIKILNVTVGLPFAHGPVQRDTSPPLVCKSPQADHVLPLTITYWRCGSSFAGHQRGSRVEFKPYAP